MLISVPYVLIWKCIAVFLADRQVLKTTQKCSQTNPFPRNRAFFSILVENKQIPRKKWSANFQNSWLFARYDILKTKWKTLRGARKASFCRILACDTALEPPRSVLSSYVQPQACTHTRHIVGTHEAHQSFGSFQFLRIFCQKFWCASCVPTMCLVCAHAWGCT